MATQNFALNLFNQDGLHIIYGAWLKNSNISCLFNSTLFLLTRSKSRFACKKKVISYRASAIMWHWCMSYYHQCTHCYKSVSLGPSDDYVTSRHLYTAYTVKQSNVNSHGRTELDRYTPTHIYENNNYLCTNERSAGRAANIYTHTNTHAHTQTQTYLPRRNYLYAYWRTYTQSHARTHTHAHTPKLNNALERYNIYIYIYIISSNIKLNNPNKIKNHTIILFWHILITYSNMSRRSHLEIIQTTYKPVNKQIKGNVHVIWNLNG